MLKNLYSSYILLGSWIEYTFLPQLTLLDHKNGRAPLKLAQSTETDNLQHLKKKRGNFDHFVKNWFTALPLRGAFHWFKSTP